MREDYRYLRSPPYYQTYYGGEILNPFKRIYLRWQTFLWLRQSAKLVSLFWPLLSKVHPEGTNHYTSRRYEGNIGALNIRISCDTVTPAGWNSAFLTLKTSLRIESRNNDSWIDFERVSTLEQDGETSEVKTIRLGPDGGLSLSKVKEMMGAEL